MDDVWEQQIFKKKIKEKKNQLLIAEDFWRSPDVQVEDLGICLNEVWLSELGWFWYVCDLSNQIDRLKYFKYLLSSK